MTERTPHYALFEGDEVDGKVYAFGEELADSVDAGTLAYLVGIGRVGATKPSGENRTPVAPPALPDDSDPVTAQLKTLVDKPLADMSRAELELTARSMVDLSGYGDDVLRDRIAEYRAHGGRPPEDHDDGDAGDDEADEDIALLDGNVADLTTGVGKIEDVERLKGLRASEEADKNRASALKAIDDRIAALTPPPPPPES